MDKYFQKARLQKNCHPDRSLWKMNLTLRTCGTEERGEHGNGRVNASTRGQTAQAPLLTRPSRKASEAKLGKRGVVNANRKPEFREQNVAHYDSQRIHCESSVNVNVVPGE